MHKGCKIEICMQDYYNKVLAALKGGCLLALWTRGSRINQVWNPARAIKPFEKQTAAASVEDAHLIYGILEQARADLFVVQMY